MPASRMSDSTTRDARNLPNGSSRRVSFGNVEIIELPYALGDNPSVTCGVPISASWKSQKRTKLQLDYFETYRPNRRTKKQLLLSREDRKQL